MLFQRLSLLVLLTTQLLACSASKKSHLLAERATQLGLPPGKESETIAYGYELVSHTALYLGPHAENPQLRLANTQMSCSACHLKAGQDEKALGFTGIIYRYPRFRAVENRKIDLQERINSCFERSLNARQPLPKNGEELQALEAYMRWLSRNLSAATAPQDIQLPPIQWLQRPADPNAGKQLYAYHCAACHGEQGQGLLRNPQQPQQGYTFPPVWGPESYGTGSNFNRLTVLARYLKANMPLGRPVLTDAQAFDIAAYLNSQPRPVWKAEEKDYPDRKQKPVDVPYPPWSDTWPPERHRLGPFFSSGP